MSQRPVADYLSDPRHAAPLDGATLLGEASGDDRLLVRVGLWLDGRGHVRRARYRASCCAALIAYAEAACELAEAGAATGPPVAGPLLAAVTGVHPRHRDRAELVAQALARAFARAHPTTGATP